VSTEGELLEEIQKILKQAFPDDKTIATYIGEILEFAKTAKVDWNVNETSKKIGIAFLDEAERDLKSCKRLYSKKIYAHSVYHLQQAVEKSVKGYCLGLGISTIEDVRVRGHDTPYILLRAALEKTGMKTMLRGLSDDSKNRIDRAWEAMDRRENRVEIAKITFEQVKMHLSDIDRNEVTMNEVVNKLNPVLTLINPKESPPIFFQILPTLARLYVLASLSFPHEEFTRYPDGEITPAEYTSKSGIVQGIPKMIKYLVPVIEELRLAFKGEIIS
jgi:hypothetical protein